MGNSNSIKEIPSQFKLYPNPVQNILNIETINHVQKLEILTLTGQLIRQKNNFSNTPFIETSELDRGLYFLKITERNGNTSFLKFIKL